jgi:uncharacterized protein YqeY
MTLQETLQNDMRSAEAGRRKEALKLAVSEMQREPQKIVTDERVVKILNKLIVSEREMLKALAERNGTVFVDSTFITTLESYLPKEVSEEEVRAWVQANIDLSTFKNRMQAMKPVMAQFTGRIDGNKVKAILENL